MSEFETIGLEPVESLTITTLGYSQDTPEMCNSPLRTAETSQVVALSELLVTTWTTCWKLDLDFLTYGAKGPADSPEPQA